MTGSEPAGGVRTGGRGKARELQMWRVGIAGWAIPPQYREHFPATGTHLERYASVFDTVEINSSFYRPHKRSTYQRWAASVPESFRFAVKCPRTITHDARLVGCGDLLRAFFEAVEGLRVKRGPILVQLPPGLVFHSGRAEAFFSDLRSVDQGEVVCEARNAGWFGAEADELLRRFQIGRVLADPPAGGDVDPLTGGKPFYARLHGTPEMYYSAYGREKLERWAARVGATPGWVIFDNTARGAAVSDALVFRDLVGACDARLQRTP